MAKTKVLTTHVSLPSLGMMHVKGSRLETMALIEQAANGGAFGVDLTLLGRKTSKGPMLQTNLWVGFMELAHAVIAGEHTVEADLDAVWGEDTDKASALEVNPDTLEVSL